MHLISECWHRIQMLDQFEKSTTALGGCGGSDGCGRQGGDDPVFSLELRLLGITVFFCLKCFLLRNFINFIVNLNVDERTDFIHFQ